MKKTSNWFATTLISAALMGLGALPAFAAADIYEIYPFRHDPSSVVREYVPNVTDAGLHKEYATEAKPLSSGDVYFSVRLVTRRAGGSTLQNGRFQLVHQGSGSVESDMFFYPPKIGIFVGGQANWASMVLQPTIMPFNYYDASRGNADYIYDMVFKYTLQPGDIGLPIYLSDNSGNPIIPGSTTSGVIYRTMNIGDGYPWRIEYFTAKEGGTTGGDVGFTHAPTSEGRRDVGLKRITGGDPTYETDKDDVLDNFSLRECGFYTQTVDFDRDEVRNPGWKKVRRGRTNQASVDIINGELFATNALKGATLYVWAVSPDWPTPGKKPDVTKWDPNPAVEMVGEDTTVTIGFDEAGKAIWRPVKMATVNIPKGATYANFQFTGLTADKAATLILSSTPDFHYNAPTGYTLNKDYVTCNVECEEGQPELWLKLTEKTDIYTVTSDYTSTLTTMKLTLTDAYDEDINVTITPSLKEPWAGHVWSDVVRLSGEADPRTGWKSEDPLTLKIPKGSTASLPVYLYGMGATADQNLWTSGLGQEVTFTLTYDKGETFIKAKVIDNLYVRPALPVIANAAEIAEITVPSGEPEPVSFVMSDNFTDMADKTTGYTVKALWWDDGEEPSDLKFRQNAFDLTTAKSGISTFKPDANGVLTALKDGAMIVDDLPVIPSDVRGQNLRIRITAPNTAQTAYHDIRVTVVTKPKAEASAYETKSGDYVPDSFPEVKDDAEGEGDATMAYIGVSLESPNTSGGDLYAFLRLKDEATQKDLVSGRCVIIDGKASQGIRIRAKESKEYARGELKLLDGIKDGTLLEFDVVLCTTKAYDEKKIYTKFDTTTALEILVDNVKPYLNNAFMNGRPLTGDKSAFKGSATVGIEQTFKFDVWDAELDKLAEGEKAFKLAYNFEDGTTVTEGMEVTGDPSKWAIKYKFNTVGPEAGALNYTITDKDGGKITGRIIVPVTANPFVTIRRTDVPEGVYFDEGSCPQFEITLSEKADARLTVRLNVKALTTGTKRGKLEIDGGTFVSEGIYDFVFEANEVVNTFGVKDSDGTAGGASKFTMTAAVTTETLKPGTTTKWCDYYTSGALGPLTVQNVNPTLTVDGRICPKDEEEASTAICYLNSSNAPTQVAIGEADPITWSTDDVKADLDAGITVTIVDQYGTHKDTYYNTDDQTFTPQFKYAGPTTVTLTALDKDGGSMQAVRYYTVKATRQLSIAAVGPSENGNASPHASYYRGAGRGEGHVFADAKCTGAIGFIFDFNCGLAASVKATAQGYRVGDIDDGRLKKNGSLGDNAITQDGSLATNKTDVFVYQGNRDSFFYVWVKDTLGEDGKFTSEIYGDVSPEVKMAGQATFTMPTEVDKETGAYPLSQYEAIFSKEFLKSDNIGDINADAIPDIYALGYKGFGVSGEDKTDMTDLGQYNGDGDYFPFIFDNVQGSFIFLPSNSWPSATKKFTARLEIRGWGDHLNDAYQVLVSQGYAGSIPEYTAEKVYTDPAVDTNSTLTAVEYDAWVQAGKDPNWSPERPTDPTKVDTDGDGMPDGYEYYIWYKAHVGWMENGEHKYMTGRKYNPANPYAPFEITSKAIAAAFDPLARAGSDWDVRDTDDDGLTDYAEYLLGTNPFDYDTDGDGLPDGYEVAISKTNPMNADTDNNGTPDGEENPDNDSLATIDQDMFFVSARDDGGKTYYYCCDTASDGDFDEHLNPVTEAGSNATWYVAYPYKVGYARGSSTTIGATNVLMRLSTAVKLLHYQVYQAKGFNPYTGWFHPPTSGSVDTADFTTMDEFLSMVFFHKTGSLSEADLQVTPTRSRIWIWQHYSTNPLSADSDEDKMPDGWEFYLMANVGDAGPGSNYSPLYNFNKIVSSELRDNDNNLIGDGLEWPQEYSGCNDPRTGRVGPSQRYGWTPLKPTWRNKFLPTDPWDYDTDDDGLSDGIEGGSPYWDKAHDPDKWYMNEVQASCFFNASGMAGGGLNPLSMDTDSDGLPDPWELEFHGTWTATDSATVEVPSGTTSNTTSVVVGNRAVWNMDGMNPTVTDTRLDYDGDGLANWQEYMTGAMRCWRYDDCWDSWGAQTATFENLPDPGTDEWNQYWYDRLLDTGNTNGCYNPHLANGYFDLGTYFTRCTHKWDSAYGMYYYFQDGVNHNLTNTGMDNPAIRKVTTSPDPVTYIYMAAPRHYICTDPRAVDSDGDGLDDFYELFHGLNPLLGKAGVPKATLTPPFNACDLVYDAYARTVYYVGGGGAFASALNNWWLNETKPHATGMSSGIKNPEVGGYDFLAHPWLNGLVSADPDGDNIVNQEEAILPNAQAPMTYHHSDPSPLWMTDSSYTNSLTQLYYRNRAPQNCEDTSVMIFNALGGGASFVDPTTGKEHSLSEFDGFRLSDDGSLVTFSYSINMFYVLTDWMWSFEENEGYDSDHDYLSDYEEGQGKTKNASDVLVHDDPLRRQALYFNGVDAFLQTPVAEAEETVGTRSNAEARQNFLYYTVECWAKPDAESLKNDNQLRTLVERAIWADNASAADETRMRKNFLIGVRNGRWYTCFDSTGTDIQPVEINNGPVATTNWTHIAATFDGTALRLYVNGICNNVHNTSVQPEHGVNALAVNRIGAMNPTGYSYFYNPMCISILVGASAQTELGLVFDSAWRLRDYAYVSETNPEGLYTNRTASTYGTALKDYHNFYKGYIDEVRIWDGARSAADIQSDVDNRVRYTFELAKENRQAVYNQWKEGGLRSPVSATGTELPAQLMYHWAFDHLPGAVLTNDVIQVPAGFDTDRSVLNAKARWSRPADYVERNWNSTAVRSTVYTDNAWVPWVNNTVAHLPRFDKTTLDSFYWSDNYCGYDEHDNQFPRTAEVPSRWKQLQYAEPEYYDSHGDMFFDFYNFGSGEYKSLPSSIQDTRWHAIAGYLNVIELTDEVYAMRFTLRDRNVSGDDLLPMGGVYPRRISATEGGMWDNLPSELPKAADAWAETGNDADNNGLPDWWEDYARKNYCQGLSPEDPLNWDTTVTYYGVKMPAYQAYLRDLASGMVKIGSTVKYDEAYEDKRDNDKDGLPDWWEEMYGLDTSVDNADVDSDNDGLSNYQEYILGEYYLTKFRKPFADAGIDVAKVNLNPLLAFSSANQVVPDYFLCYDLDARRHLSIPSVDQPKFFTDEYFGEIATDHDFMEDWWEQLYDFSYTNSKKYDPSFDRDGDGWSTYAECRASLWGGYFAASLIDQWSGSLSNQYVPCRPQPIIGVRATYYGKQDISGHQLIVRTSSGQTQRTDATFVVPPTLEAQTKYIGGFAGDTILHGHLTPGQLNANSVIFDRARLSNEKVYTWNCNWYKENTPDAAGWDRTSSIFYDGWLPWNSCASVHSGSFAKYKEEFAKWPMIQVDNADMAWESFVVNIPSADMRSAKLLIDGITEFGTVDCVTGEFELDMSKFSGEGAADEYVYRATYTSRIGHEWPQTVYLSDTRELTGGTGDGYVREGKNTIEAFIDLDEDGAYTAGEPYGVVQNVDVGWHKVPVTVIELKDTSHVVPRFNVATMTDDRSVVSGAAGGTSQSGASGEGEATGLTRTFTIKRVAINGSDQATTLNNVIMAVPKRTLMTKTLVLDSRPYLTESDVLGNAKFDLDSRWLVSDAEEKLGLKRSEIDNATYEISEVFTAGDGTTSNVVLKTFVNTFNPQRVKPTAMAPIDQAPVYASSPTFTFASGDETMTAYRLQVATKTDGTLVYDSGDGKEGHNLLLLPGRVPNAAGSAVYTVTPPIYANARVCAGMITNTVFADSQDYKWRVALFNAKFNEIEKDEDWSDWAEFQMDVGNNNRYPYQATGYGSASVSVRYYGPTNATPDRIWVEAFENADFRGQPAARATLSSIEHFASYKDIAHTNALVSGLAPGTYYFRAFIDFNGNGQRDAWESWGYNNYVGKGMKALYNPKPYVVTAATADWKASGNADFTIFIEDCDTNQNEIPDCLEFIDGTGTTATDSDKDGIADDEEEMYSTNSQLFDTDNDGMPDGFEAKFAETDPTLSDADECIAGDVMAFAKCDAVLLVVTTDGTDKTTYMLEKDQPVPTRGDDAKGLVVRTTYTYPVCVDGKITEYYGVGTNLTLKAGTTVVSVNAEGTVVLVHEQVYDTFGFNPKTCVADDDAVNTKPFTALDKYLVVRYYDAMGKIKYDTTEYASGEQYVNMAGRWEDYTLKPYEIDYDKRGINDDKRRGDGIADGWELYVGLNPWSYDDAREPSKGGEGLTNLQEYDGGHYPTDPNNGDTDGDNVSDKYAYQYHLKGGDAGLDNDGDGLSNYAEYLISEVFKFAMLDPDNPKTDGSCVDYFRKVGDLYFGEVFTDHDQVNDTWEQKYSEKANRDVYDPARDDDKDGWSNWAEAKAGTHPGTDLTPGVDNEVLIEWPLPTIAATVLYNGEKTLSGNMVFQAWNAGKDPQMVHAPDAAWMATATDGSTNVTRYVGLNPGQTTSFYLGTGVVSPGSLRVWFRDTAAVNVITSTNGNVAVSTATNPQWYYFVADSQVNNYAGDLLLCVTNMAAVKVGTIDYSSGLVTIDFGSEALQQKVIDKWINGTDASGAAKSTGVASTAVQIDLKRSFVKLEWKPVGISIASGRATYYLSDCAAEPANEGRVLEGSNKFVVFCDLNQDATWNPGEPFGFVQDVGIGWQGGAFTVELTDVSPVFARVNLLAALGEKATDRQYLQPNPSSVFDLVENATAEPEKTYRAKLAEIGAKPLDVALTADDGLTRVRVVRAFVDGDYKLGKTKDLKRDVLVGKEVILDKHLDLNTRSYLHEGDFLINGEHDVGWTTLYSGTLKREVYEGSTQSSTQGSLKFIEGTNVSYMIVLGEDAIADGSKGSNTIFRCLINKNYDLSAARAKGFPKVIRPRIDTKTPGIVYGAQPTFRWRMQNEEGINFNSYTAFEVQIRLGEKVLYTSGVRDLPPTSRDATGVTYEWTLDRSLESIVGTSGEYTWRVAMYNAKFTGERYRNVDVDLWSDNGTITVNLNQQQPMNDHTYSSIAAAVKYAGPAAVLEKNPKVYLQAYTTADFAGLPVGETFVTDRIEIANTAHVVSNACVHGVFQRGTYYLKAFIDSNGNGVQDDFESWGGASEPVLIDANTVTVPTVGLYIEDADTDGDWIPDAYEYALKGNLTEISGDIIDGDTIKFTGPAGSTGDAGVSTGLSGASLTIFQNGTYAKLVAGNLNAEVKINDIRAAVEKMVNPKTVKITALSLAPDGKTVTLSVAAEVTDSIAGQLLGKVYKDLVSETVNVTIKVYKKANLATADWGEAIYTGEKNIGKTDVQVDVPVNGIDMTSGFYKIEIEQKK